MAHWAFQLYWCESSQLHWNWIEFSFCLSHIYAEFAGNFEWMEMIQSRSSEQLHAIRMEFQEKPSVPASTRLQNHLDSSVLCWFASHWRRRSSAHTSGVNINLIYAPHLTGSFCQPNGEETILTSLIILLLFTIANSHALCAAIKWRRTNIISGKLYAGNVNKFHSQRLNMPVAVYLCVMRSLVSLIHNAKNWIGSIKRHQLHLFRR